MKPELGGTIGAALLCCGQTNADIAPLLARTRLFRPPVIQVCMLQRQVQHGRVVAAIVKIARRHLVGELVRLDKVAPPQFNTINPQFLRSRVYQPL